MIIYPPIKSFEWPELHGKILKIAVAEANPEGLEFTTQVFGRDIETGTAYLMAEIPSRHEAENTALKARVEKLRGALRFYADREHLYSMPCDAEYGTTAQKALEADI